MHETLRFCKRLDNYNVFPTKANSNFRQMKLNGMSNKVQLPSKMKASAEDASKNQSGDEVRLSQVFRTKRIYLIKVTIDLFQNVMFYWGWTFVFEIFWLRRRGQNFLDTISNTSMSLHVKQVSSLKCCIHKKDNSDRSIKSIQQITKFECSRNCFLAIKV